MSMHNNYQAFINRTKTDSNGCMTLMALDPGLTTGVAIRVDNPVFEVVASNPTEDSTPIYAPSNTSSYVTLVVHKSTDILELLKYHQPTVVIFEDFNSAGHIDKNGQATIRLIGAIETMTYILGIPTCLQFPRERYPFIPPARQLIKAMNKKYLVHEIDALSHLLLYEDRVNRGVLDQITQRRRTNRVTAS